MNIKTYLLFIFLLLGGEIAKGQKKTIVTKTILPLTNDIPVVYQNNIKGGVHQVTDTSDINENLLDTAMIAMIYKNHNVYQWNGSNWRQIQLIRQWETDAVFYTGDLFIYNNVMFAALKNDTIAASDNPYTDCTTWSNIASACFAGNAVTAIDSNGITVLNDTLHLEYADSIHPGIVSFDSQIFAGNKFFADSVAIGTTSPQARLQINGSLLSTGTLNTSDSITISGAGTRMMWFPAKAAFRAGYVSGTYWDNDSIGAYSFATGYNTMASGYSSTAMGYSTTSSGEASIAMGVGGTTASGDYSTAIGRNPTASGFSSTAMGTSTEASGDYSTAMGENTTASGDYSTTIGRETTASGNYSTAMGLQTEASEAYSTAMGLQTKASGTLTTAMGYKTEASEWAATAMGESTTASGKYSTAMGYGTTASGSSSTAMGYGTTASGNYSTAMGHYTEASAYASTAIGRYNVGGGTSDSWVATDPLFEIGNGTSATDPSNAFTVLKNGNVGIGIATPDASLHITGNIKMVDGNQGERQILISDSTGVASWNSIGSLIDTTISLDDAYNNGRTITADSGAFEVNGTSGALFTGTFGSSDSVTISGAGTRMMWIPAKAAFRAGRVDGTQWDNDSIGIYSFATGYNTMASGGISTAMGSYTTASENYSTAMGYGTIASGGRSTAMGSSTTASGFISSTMGAYTTASGNYSTAMGSHTTASGKYSTAMGYYTTASGDFSTAMGYYTTASGDVSSAMGSYTTSSGNFSTAMGRNTTASAYASTAIGQYNVGGGTADSWVATDPLFEIGNGTSATDTSNALTIYKNGDATLAGDMTAASFTTSSDKRLKKNIETLTDVLDNINKIRGIRFVFKNQQKYASGPQIGVIAQELQKIYPELVSEDNDGYLTVNYSQLSAVVLQAIKEQQQEIELLKEQIELQKKQMKQVMNKLGIE